MPLDGKRSRACSKRTSPRVAGGSAAVSKEPGRERQVSQRKGQTQTFDAGKVQSVSSKLWSCHLSKLSPIGTLEADGRAPIGAHARIPVPPTELLQSAPPSWDPTFPVVASWRHPAPLPANFCPAHTKTNLDFFLFPLPLNVTTTISAPPVTMTAFKKETPRTGLATVCSGHPPPKFPKMRDLAVRQSLRGARSIAEVAKC